MAVWLIIMKACEILQILTKLVNPLNAELNPIFYLLTLGAHHFLHVSRIRVKSLTLNIYIYIYIYIYMTLVAQRLKGKTEMGIYCI